MSGGHGHGLHVHGDTLVHRMSPQVKIISALGFAFLVVLTPRTALPAFAAYGVLVVGAAAVATLSPWFLAKRIILEVPFVAFALALPFLGGGPHVEILGLSLSSAGLWAAWNILAKATLGLFAMIVVAATTAPADLIGGLDRLRLPRVLTGIMSFMVRYAEVLGGEMKRSATARALRGAKSGWLWQARAIATSLGNLFIRSFERGERVYAAMLSRGYAGRLPAARGRRAGAADIAGAAAFLAPALCVSISALYLA